MGFVVSVGFDSGRVACFALPRWIPKQLSWISLHMRWLCKGGKGPVMSTCVGRRSLGVCCRWHQGGGGLFFDNGGSVALFGIDAAFTTAVLGSKHQLLLPWKVWSAKTFVACIRWLVISI